MSRKNRPAIQFDDGGLGCPQCRVRLAPGRSNVFVDGLNIGAYDSIRCEFCGFFLLAAKGFDDTKPAIRRYGLVVADDHIVAEQKPMLEGKSEVQLSTYKGTSASSNDHAILFDEQNTREMVSNTGSESTHGVPSAKPVAATAQHSTSAKRVTVHLTKP